MDRSELKELLRTSLTGRISGIETFNQFTENKKSLVFKLYSNIIAGKINTDAEARAELYGKNYSGKSYDVLKRRFKEKLYTNVLFVQPRDKNTKSYAWNAYFVHKHYVVGKVLLMATARSAGRLILQKVLKRALLFEITEIAMLAALKLKREAAVIGDRKLHLKYSQLFQYTLDTLKAETDAEEKYEELFMYFSKSYKARPELIPQAKEAFAYIDKLKNAFGTFVLQQTSFQASVFYSTLCNDYKSTLKTCIAFEQYLLSRPAFYSQVRHGHIIINKLNCYLYLGKYSAGLAEAENGLKLYESKEGNWLVLQEIHFLLAMRAGNYSLAASIFIAVADMQKRKNIDERQKEMWRIFNGYLWFCTAQNNMDRETEKTSFPKTFNMAKLMNETAVYSKDKEGINLSLGILQLCLLLQNNNPAKAIDKIEQLKIYMYRYISRKDAVREHVFLKMILLLQKYNFHAPLVEKKSEKLLIELARVKNLNTIYTKAHIEVLTYQKLWKIILNILYKNEADLIT
ncbi:MAG: hypothetical protein EOP53_17080 [Sphingobacteriales bacterium]|nr:MAG: hypothetical protein EOP53_17080 [Sphingobacteriales bacterium]